LDATVAGVRGKIEVRGGRIRVGRGDWHEVGTEPIVVGRNAACQLVVEDTKVSAVHAEFVATPTGVRLRDLGHALLDRGQVFRRERSRVREDVEEAVVDDGADRHLRVRVQLLDRLGQQVRRRMADDVEAVLAGDQRPLRLLLKFGR
jgi:hypothetical protein